MNGLESLPEMTQQHGVDYPERDEMVACEISISWRLNRTQIVDGRPVITPVVEKSSCALKIVRLALPF